MKMIEYYYIYFVNENFSLGTKMIYIHSVLEDALSAKSLIFLILLQFYLETKGLLYITTKIEILLY